MELIPHHVQPHVQIMNFDHIRNLTNELPLEDKEKLISDIIGELPSEVKSRIIERQLGQSGLVVVMGGSNCSVNTEFCFQIQNAPNVDIAAIIEAAVKRRQKDRRSKN